ncbi:MAG TPA: RNA-binding cell elongation regulator Jag/EloR [Ktedonobacteraceae bacterium]|nr:RNA-binding cell elongation regulator Jag/EloR [Ktedonobacteraceae bacterium]
MDSIEASGKSVDEAVMQALSRLGKRRDEVDVTVLQEPSRGAFGLGGRDARVRVTPRPTHASAVITPEMADAILGPDGPDMPLDEEEEELYDEEEEEELYDDEEEEEEDEEYEEEEDEESLPFIPSTEVAAPFSLVPPQETEVREAEEGNRLQNVENPSREDIEITVDVLQNVLRYMNIHATVQVRSNNPLTLNIHGINENLGLLIGRRGETLAALQLLVNLIVSHRTKHRMRIIVDAENYRERREENLRSLALRVAQQVRNYRRSIALEAMPPHERRIVHIALSESKDISTESIGEGDERRVVISLKRPGR